MSVFISYTHDDAPIVEAIAKSLVDKNVHIWIDRWELLPGDSLLDRIQNAITDSSVLLVMLSNKSLESNWCKKELNSGLMRELEERRVIVIPVLLEKCNIPLFLKEKYYADFTGDYSAAIKKLYNSLLKFTNGNMNKVVGSKFIRDYAFEDGIFDGAMILNIDSVSYSEDKEYSVFCNIKLIGNTTITQAYRKEKDARQEFKYLTNILQKILKYGDTCEFKIRITDNCAIHQEFEVRLGNSESCVIVIYVRRMGIDNGFDVLFDSKSIIEAIFEKRIEISGS